MPMNHLTCNPPNNDSQQPNRRTFLHHQHSTSRPFPTKIFPYITISYLPTHLVLHQSFQQRRLHDYCIHPKSSRTIYHTICTIFHDGYSSIYHTIYTYPSTIHIRPTRFLTCSPCPSLFLSYQILYILLYLYPSLLPSYPLHLLSSSSHPFPLFSIQFSSYLYHLPRNNSTNE